MMGRVSGTSLVTSTVVAYLTFLCQPSYVTSVDTDCWSFVWPGPFNWQSLNVTAVCKKIDIMVGDETPSAPSPAAATIMPSRQEDLFTDSGRMSISINDIGDYVVDTDDSNSILGYRVMTLRPFGDEGEVYELDAGVPCDHPVVFSRKLFI